MSTTEEEVETVEEIEEALMHLKHTASRCFQVVGTEEHPTPWDKAHGQINDLLYARERVVASS
jgi:hypothetical protein